MSLIYTFSVYTIYKIQIYRLYALGILQSILDEANSNNVYTRLLIQYMYNTYMYVLTGEIYTLDQWLATLLYNFAFTKLFV